MVCSLCSRSVVSVPGHYLLALLGWYVWAVPPDIGQKHVLGSKVQQTADREQEGMGSGIDVSMCICVTPPCQAARMLRLFNPLISNVVLRGREVLNIPTEGN